MAYDFKFSPANRIAPVGERSMAYEEYRERIEHTEKRVMCILKSVNLILHPKISDYYIKSYMNRLGSNYSEKEKIK